MKRRLKVHNALSNMKRGKSRKVRNINNCYVKVTKINDCWVMEHYTEVMYTRDIFNAISIINSAIR